jgi:hypothetical protein
MLMVKANGDGYLVESEERPSLLEMQGLVGGYIERTLCVFTDHREGQRESVMLVNEDGIGMDLPYNLMASEYARQRIVGDVLILQNFDLE